jgi:glycosyltransferase involved in cell wall biosynthesis
MNNNSGFSVIIPTLHEEKSIGHTLASIQNAAINSNHSIEMIIVDGGSRDRTREIANKYTNNVLLFKEPGIARARNHGAMNAIGDILVFIDADTRIPKNFFNKIHHTLNNFDVVGANCNSMPCRTINPTKTEAGFYKMWSVVRRGVYKFKPCGTGENGIIIKKKTFNKIRGFREDLETIEDLDFVFRASRFGRFVFLKDITIYETIRRFREMRMPRFILTYVSNFFYYILTRKTNVKKWKPVR